MARFKWIFNSQASTTHHCHSQRPLQTRTTRFTINLQSTSSNLSTIEDNSMYPPSDVTDIKTHDATYSVTSKEHRAFMDLTGRFPHWSTRGNEYILVVYDYDSNVILDTPLENRQAATIISAWHLLHDKLHRAGVSLITWILDNEVSQDLKTFMTKKTPPSKTCSPSYSPW